MSRGPFLACCAILFLLSAAITSRLANDDGPFEPRQAPQPIISDTPTNALGPETASRTEQLAKIIDAFDSPSLPPALPIVGFVRSRNGTPIAGATVGAKARLAPIPKEEASTEEQLANWLEKEVRSEKVTSSPIQTITDETGRFELTDLPLTRYLVSAEHPMWRFDSQQSQPGSFILFKGLKRSAQIEFQVRFADGTIPEEAHLYLIRRGLPQRWIKSGESPTSVVNKILNKNEKFATWNRDHPIHEVHTGEFFVFARTPEGAVSEPVVATSEYSAVNQKITLEINQTGSIQVDVVNAEGGVIHDCYALLIDPLRPPPATVLHRGRKFPDLGGGWPRSLGWVPPGNYLVGVGSSRAIWAYQVVEVGDRPVEVLLDLTDPDASGSLLARVVDGTGETIDASFKFRAEPSRPLTWQMKAPSTLHAPSFLGADGLYRVRVPEEAIGANRLLLSASTTHGTMSVEIGENRLHPFEFRFTASGTVRLNFFGLDEAWGSHFGVILVPRGEEVGLRSWTRVSGDWNSTERQQLRGVAHLKLGTIPVGDYDIVIGIDSSRSRQTGMNAFVRAMSGGYQPTLEVARQPFSFKGGDLKIPIGVPPIYEIEILTDGLWKFTLTPEGGASIPIGVPSYLEQVITLPAGIFEVSSPTHSQTIVVPQQRQIDLRGEGR